MLQSSKRFSNQSSLSIPQHGISMLSGNAQTKTIQVQRICRRENQQVRITCALACRVEPCKVLRPAKMHRLWASITNRVHRKSVYVRFISDPREFLLFDAP